jgi:hypothetical protein
MAIACSDESDTETTRVEYDVSVAFTQDYTQLDLDAVADYLRTFDSDADYLVQESFPPTLRATMTVEEPDFCDAIQAELSGRPYVASVTCREPPDEPASSPDEPVSTEAR